MSRKPDQKPRGDSHLDNLLPEQKDQLSEWLTVENLTYAKARMRVREKFGVSTTPSALSSFFGSVALPWKYARDHSSAHEMASWKQGEFRPATMKRLEQLAFQLASSNRVDVKTLKAFVKMITDGEKVALQKQNLNLSIEKFRESVKSNVEKGLDALEAEIKGNAEAMTLFAKMKAAVRTGMEAAK